MGKQVLITGASGMVGKGVLLECIDSPEVSDIIILVRNKINISDKKVKQVILKDFTQINSVKNELGKPAACFHCMGVSSVGMNESTFSELTFDVTRILADTMYSLNKDMVFCYVSGTGTDSTEKGNTMWARVKGKTENYILKLGFKAAYMFRPGIIIPEKGIQSRTRLYNISYKIMRPFFPLFKRMKNVTTTTRIGQAMIRCLYFTDIASHLENVEINQTRCAVRKIGHF
ncbi:MAG: NAD-dependent epimerase/dehydratase family protein [Bacteroidetes bacterium]|nr:NAD-dependent epimerase/dehydratase family protein [Bacteroidota bacterium]